MTCGICGRERPYCPSCAVDGEKERHVPALLQRSKRSVVSTPLEGRPMGDLTQQEALGC